SVLDAPGHRVRPADRDRRHQRAGRRARRRARRADAGERDPRAPDPRPHPRRARARGLAMEQLRLARTALDQMLAHARATHPEVAYVVVSDSRTPGEARAFRWSESARDFVEVPIEVC